MEPERYSAETKAWIEIGGQKVSLSRTNDQQFVTTVPRCLMPVEAVLVTSVDGVEHRRLIRITGGVAWEYEEIPEDRSHDRQEAAQASL